VVRIFRRLSGEKKSFSEKLFVFKNIHLVHNVKELLLFFFKEMPEYFICGITNMKPEKIFKDAESYVYIKRNWSSFF
jgi:hypothetical protein